MWRKAIIGMRQNYEKKRKLFVRDFFFRFAWSFEKDKVNQWSAICLHVIFDAKKRRENFRSV